MKKETERLRVIDKDRKGFMCAVERERENEGNRERWKGDAC